MNDEERSGVLPVRRPAKRAERFGLALNFWPTFSFKRKGGKTYIRRTDEKSKEAIGRCQINSGRTVQ